MLHSFFLLTCDGEILIEKHWRGRILRSVVEDFWTSYVTKVDSTADVPPVVCTSKYYFVHYQHNELTFLAVLVNETPALMVLELLQQMSAVFSSYFNDNLCVDAIKENFSVVFHLLDEMVDHGVPICTDASLLKERVPPSTMISRVRAAVGAEKKGENETFVMDGAATSWRKPGIRYSANEILFDIVEELDAIVDSDGSVVMADVRGRLEAVSRLSGMPDVALVWANPEVLDDAAIHPCVQHLKYEQDRSLSFTPPDGSCVLMTYHHTLPRTFTTPFYVRPQITFHKDEGRVNVLVGMKSGLAYAPSDKTSIVQKMEVTVPLPKSAEGVRIETTQGTHTYNTLTRVITWCVGAVSTGQSPSLTAIVQMPSDSDVTGCGEGVGVKFRLPGVALSGLKVESVNIYREKYKAYKGIKYTSTSGKLVVRT
eukprot:PhM_4_TR11321/c0_g1_i1/m.51727/K12398/AP3M; AP-3 complex subunit mu